MRAPGGSWPPGRGLPWRAAPPRRGGLARLWAGGIVLFVRALAPRHACPLRPRRKCQDLRGAGVVPPGAGPGADRAACGRPGGRAPRGPRPGGRAAGGAGIPYGAGGGSSRSRARAFPRRACLGVMPAENVNKKRAGPSLGQPSESFFRRVRVPLPAPPLYPPGVCCGQAYHIGGRGAGRLAIPT